MLQPVNYTCLSWSPWPCPSGFLKCFIFTSLHLLSIYFSHSFSLCVCVNTLQPVHSSFQFPMMHRLIRRRMTSSSQESCQRTWAGNGCTRLAVFMDRKWFCLRLTVHRATRTRLLMFIMTKAARKACCQCLLPRLSSFSFVPCRFRLSFLVHPSDCRSVAGEHRQFQPQASGEDRVLFCCGGTGLCAGWPAFSINLVLLVYTSKWSVFVSAVA